MSDNYEIEFKAPPAYAVSKESDEWRYVGLNETLGAQVYEAVRRYLVDGREIQGWKPDPAERGLFVRPASLEELEAARQELARRYHLETLDENVQLSYMLQLNTVSHRLREYCQVSLMSDSQLLASAGGVAQLHEAAHQCFTSIQEAEMVRMASIGVGLTLQEELQLQNFETVMQEEKQLAYIY